MPPKRKPTKPAQPNQSIEWGVSCLMELTAAEEPVTCKRISERLGIEKTKAGRLMGTLAYLGLAERLPDLSYIPGPAIHLLSAMSLRSSGLLRYALPHFQRMKKKWGLNARLAVLWHDQVCYLYHSGGGRELEEAIAWARPWPAKDAPIGRLLLAEKDDAEIRAILGVDLPSAELDEIMAAIAHVREHGYLIHKERNLAMGIGSPASAGLAFSGPRVVSEPMEALEDVRDIVESINDRIAQAAKDGRRSEWERR